jgi:hypothetical protein
LCGIQQSVNSCQEWSCQGWQIAPEQESPSPHRARQYTTCLNPFPHFPFTRTRRTAGPTHRVVLHAHLVSHPKGVPQHRVCPCQGCILQTQQPWHAQVRRMPLHST